MKTIKVDNERRRMLTRSLGILGAATASPLIAGCEGKKLSVSDQSVTLGKYGKYSDVLSQCFSAVLQDIMDGMDHRNQCMDPKIKPLLPTMRTWGEALTILVEEVDKIPEQPFQIEMELIDESQPGQFIVAQCKAKKLSAFWGGLLTNAAVGHKLTGIVVDGGVRDYNEIVEIGFPVFSAGLTPYDSLGRMDGKERGIVVECGGVKVKPGDLVFGDVDGVVVVPEEISDEVIAKAAEKVRGESKVREELRSGAGVVDTFKKYGIL